MTRLLLNIYTEVLDVALMDCLLGRNIRPSKIDVSNLGESRSRGSGLQTDSGRPLQGPAPRNHPVRLTRGHWEGARSQKHPVLVPYLCLKGLLCMGLKQCGFRAKGLRAWARSALPLVKPGAVDFLPSSGFPPQDLFDRTPGSDLDPAWRTDKASTTKLPRDIPAGEDSPWPPYRRLQVF